MILERIFETAGQPPRLARRLFEPSVRDLSLARNVRMDGAKPEVAVLLGLDHHALAQYVPDGALEPRAAANRLTDVGGGKENVGLAPVRDEVRVAKGECLPLPRAVTLDASGVRSQYGRHQTGCSDNAAHSQVPQSTPRNRESKGNTRGCRAALSGVLGGAARGREAGLGEFEPGADRVASVDAGRLHLLLGLRLVAFRGAPVDLPARLGRVGEDRDPVVQDLGETRRDRERLGAAGASVGKDA